MIAPADGPPDAHVLGGGPSRPPLTIVDQLEQGERLLEAAAKVADQSDFHIWRRERNAWIELTLAALTTAGLQEEDFRAAATVPHPLAAWDLAIVGEAQAIRGGVELLRSSSAR